MGSRQYFNFLGSVWSLLPEEDQGRFGELWQAYEQVFADVYQKFSEGYLNRNIHDLLPFSTERWLPYKFNSENEIVQAATLTSVQDISQGVDLTVKRFLRFSVDNDDPIELEILGADQSRVTVDEVVSTINAYAGFRFARGILENSIVQLVSKTAGPSSKITILPTTFPSQNACEYVLGVMPEDLPAAYPEYRYPFLLPYDKVASIPEMQNKVIDEKVDTLLFEGSDYQISGKVISFREPPPVNMWARRTLVDEENPWNNFGYLMDIYEPNRPSYVNVLKGLWLAFWTGSKPNNVRRALYLLFGLPVAEEPCTVTSVTSTTITTRSKEGGISRTYDIPTELSAIVVVGQELGAFDPLVDGIDVFDKINKPGFIKDEIGTPGIQRFLTENASRGPSPDTDESKALVMLEEHTFLPQINVNAFVTPNINIGNVRTFLDAIKPLPKTYLFQVIIGTFQDPIEYQERLSSALDIDLTPNLDQNQTTDALDSDLLAYESSANEGFDLDPHGVLLRETVEVEVRSFGALIDTFTA